MIVFRFLLSGLLLPAVFTLCLAQVTPDRETAMNLIESHLASNPSGLSPADWSGLLITDLYTGRSSNLTYLYLQQRKEGIPVETATATAVIDQEGNLQVFNSRLMAGLEHRTGPSTAAYGAAEALAKAASVLGVQVPTDLTSRVLEALQDARMTTVFDPAGLAIEPIQVRLSWVPIDGERLRLAWEVNWYTLGADHRWVLQLDAVTGEELARHDLVLSCQFGSPDHVHGHDCVGYDMRGYRQSKEMRTAIASEPNSYRVFPVPVESPNHGSSQLVTNPADTLASPLGWHDTDGIPGAEFTITRGNNVHAYQDSDDINDSSGDEPDGGSDLIFDFPYNPNDAPETYQDAAVTNLFYWCNIMHDVWYNYGFDEPAGNFQLNNFGLGGEEGDYIRAEAQDGSGLNNANFSSGGDGTNARIQMYLWTNQSNSFYLEVLGPDTVAGFYQTSAANFGPPVPETALVGTLVQGLDASATPTECCTALVNGDEIEGNIALVDRGNCPFVDKVANAEVAGATAVIVCNNTPGGTISMGGNNGSITIPSVMISMEDCMTLKQFLNLGVTAKLQDDNSSTTFFDGDFDNGIIAHEYGHGLSIRMTGGPSQGGCLFNDEQMGEGWSDYAGLVLTMEPGDKRGDVRGIGTFAINQSTTGNGIRPAPYSTDFAVNPFTYGNSNDANISMPHGVGFIWATALWELTWDLIEVYGFDENFASGEGGNTIAIQLVTEGMKLQPCNPGMVDGRDAILAADQLLYDGANQCLIWEAFARRGLGYSASQGTPFSRTDQEEAFDLPPICQIPVVAPTALFDVNILENCTGEFRFTDASVDVPQQWFWEFGDGNTSEEQNPVHLYNGEGTYTVILTVSNPLGSSSDSITVTVDLPEAPVAVSQTVCAGSLAEIVAQSSGTVNWYQDGLLVNTGDTLKTGPLPVGQYSFDLQTEEAKPTQQVGPADNTFGPGGYHNTGFTGTIDFTAHVPLVIESVWVDAANSGDRLIQLLDASGSVANAVTVFIPEGQSTVTLNMEVPEAGSFSLAGTSVNLYRNNDGASFPYEMPGLLTMTGTSAGAEFYYYFYDWKVREQSCFSPFSNVSVDVLENPVAGFTYLIQNDDSVQFSDTSSNATEWFWEFGDGVTSTEQNPIHIYDLEGDYTVILIAGNGLCSDTVVTIVEYMRLVSNTAEIPGLEQFRLLPNPGNGHVRVQASAVHSRAFTIRITNAAGEILQSRKVTFGPTVDEWFDLSAFPTGSYFITLESEEGVATLRYLLVR